MSVHSRTAVRLIALASLMVVFVTCTDGVPTMPWGGPSAALIDGRFEGNNPEFFFLPPLASDPSGHADYDPDGFNPDLDPNVTVRVCELVIPNGDSTKAECREDADDVAVITMAVNQDHYAAGWSPGPETSGGAYGIQVFVGNKFMGRRDVLPGPPPSAACHDLPFCNVNVGQNVAIKVRIEEKALCWDGTRASIAGPCASATGQLGQEFSLVLTGSPRRAFLEIPPAPDSEIQSLLQQNGNGTVFTATMRLCEVDPFPSLLDIPTFGDCIQVITDPSDALAELQVFAEVASCYAHADDGPFNAQGSRIRLHQYGKFDNDFSDINGFATVALPTADPDPAAHVEDCLIEGTPPGGWASLPAAFGKQLLGFVQRPLRAAWDRVSTAFSVPLAWAQCSARNGCTGSTDIIRSTFKRALPSGMSHYPASSQNLGTVTAGTTTTVQVIVTDAAGDPVKGATLHFNASSGGGVEPGSFTTGDNGLATVDWTVGAGDQTLTVTGMGIAGPGEGAEDTGVFASDQKLVFLEVGSLEFNAFGKVVLSYSLQPLDVNMENENPPYAGAAVLSPVEICAAGQSGYPISVRVVNNNGTPANFSGKRERTTGTNGCVLFNDRPLRDGEDPLRVHSTGGYRLLANEELMSNRFNVRPAPKK